MCREHDGLVRFPAYIRTQLFKAREDEMSSLCVRARTFRSVLLTVVVGGGESYEATASAHFLANANAVSRRVLRAE